MNETSNSVKLLESPAALQPQESGSASTPEGAGAGPNNALLPWLRRAIPTMLVLCALGGLAVWGQQSGWTIPKFSALTGNGIAETDDWCDEHSVPESACVECNEELLAKPPTFGWCPKHGVFDCPLDHPEVAQLKTRPKITGAELDRAERALNFAERPENNSRCKLHPRRIQFASEAALAKTGLKDMPACRGSIEESVTANGEITYDQTRIASLSSPLAGRVWRVEKELGQNVAKGDVLALLDVMEVGRAKGEFFQALSQLEYKTKTLERYSTLFTDGAISEATYRAAETDLRLAQIRLMSARQALINLGLPVGEKEVKGLGLEEMSRRIQFLGLPDKVIKSLDPKTTTANLIPITAPQDGEIVFRKLVAGEMVESSKTLFVVADPSQMLLTLNVRLEETTSLGLGQMVRFRPDGGREEVTGKIRWISTGVDPKTRTVQVRAELANPNGKLRSNTFGTGRIVLREDKNAVLVPSEAVHWDGSCHIVFVQDKNFHQQGAFKVFHVRSVRPGARNGTQMEIIAGVLPGERVATQGSAILRAELLKTNLGEG